MRISDWSSDVCSSDLLLTKSGTSKLVNACTYPLTGLGCVSRVYTDLAVFDVGPSGAAVVEMVDGLTLEALRGLTGLQIDMAATPAAVGKKIGRASCRERVCQDG